MNPKAAKWYVYELVNPMTNEPFYIGKGTGSRMYEHEKETVKGVCSDKTDYIKYLDSFGFAPVKRKVATFWDEKAAYQFERELIAETQDLRNAILYKARQSNVFDSDAALEVIKTNPSGFIFYLRNTCNQVVKVTHPNKAYAACWEVFLNMAKDTIKLAASKPRNRKDLDKIWAEHKIELNYGC